MLRLGVGTAAAPTGLVTQVLPGRRVRLSWSAPDDGGRPITGYEVRPVGTLLSTMTTVGTARSIDIDADHLGAGAELQWTVSARNAAGLSAESVPSTAMRVPATAPDAPTDVVVVPGDRTLSITWRASQNPHGAMVQRYTATASLGGRSCSPEFSFGSTTGTYTCVITGLKNHVPYAVAVSADNGSGSSASASVPAEPAGDLEQVASVAVQVVAVTRMQVDWTPRPGENAATAYRVRLVPTSHFLPDQRTLEVVVPATQRRVVLDGMTPGVDYTAA